jgi:hypothetical protein
MFYRYRFILPIFIFLTAWISGSILFGETKCRDGWHSPSIGSRGACSHHGGVTSNHFLIFAASAIPSFFFFIFLDSLYRVHGRYVVSAKLPKHPLEEVLSKRQTFRIRPLPNLSSKSRAPFTCNVCQTEFQSGSTYKHSSTDRRQIKYCIECAQQLPAINAATELDRLTYENQCSLMYEEVDTYYRSHAKGKST